MNKVCLDGMSNTYKHIGRVIHHTFKQQNSRQGMSYFNDEIFEVHDDD